MRNLTKQPYATHTMHSELVLCSNMCSLKWMNYVFMHWNISWHNLALSMWVSMYSTLSLFRKLFTNFKIFQNFTISKYCIHIWNQHGKCIKMSTNMPMFGLVVLEIVCDIVIIVCAIFINKIFPFYWNMCLVWRLLPAIWSHCVG